MQEKALIRDATSEDIPNIARVNVEAWRSTYRGIISDAFLDALSYSKQEERHRRYLAEPGVFLVAELPGEGVAGYICGGRQRGDTAGHEAEVYAIYLLQSRQRTGIGTQLFRKWCAKQRQSGFNTALVWVFAQNKMGVAFYNRMGGRLVDERSMQIGSESLVTYALGWSDLKAVAKIE